MNLKKITQIARDFSAPYKITSAGSFNPEDFDPDDTGSLVKEDKKRAKEALALGVKALTRFQEMLFASDKYSLLLIFQAMDAAGKDGAIKHVMSGINPQGCQVVSFKAPTTLDLDHDFLWRCTLRLPGRGMIGIFNRSYYEEVLVVKVHPELLEKQKLPDEVIKSDIWENRYRDIRNFENYLNENGTVIIKFFLNISKEEQKKRFLERIDNPDKNWKFSAADIGERPYWDKYQKAYHEMIDKTSSGTSPWYVVPADNKWYSRIIVAAAIIDTLGSLNLSYPSVDKNKKAELRKAREILERE